MTRPWSPKHTVPESLARALIEAQFDELAPIRIEPFGVGWDNTAFLVNETFVFRFPRRQIAVEFLEAEIRVLPRIAGRLPLPVPVPTLVGRPEQRFPWPFAGHRMIAGRTACAAGLDDQQRAQSAEPLARFLAALHAIRRDEAISLGAPPDTLGRIDLDKRVPRTRVQLGQIARLGLFEDVGRFDAVVDDVLSAAPEAADDRSADSLSLVHGDLYARHLLVDDYGVLCGVIDWGDVHWGHPAIDLSIAHGFLPPAARDVFRETYGPIGDPTWRLARFRALVHAATVVTYGHEIDDGALVREGLLSLHNIAGA